MNAIHLLVAVRRRLAFLSILGGYGGAALIGADASPPPATPAKPAAPKAEQELFDGRTLAGWKLSGFDGEGEVKVEHPFKDGRGAIVAEMGGPLSGISWQDAAGLPRTNYEISLEAMKLAGEDFFCGLTFPVGKSACTFVVGGWSGMVVGLSSINYCDASENETTQTKRFSPDRWYRIRVRVTDEKIEAWIDDEQFVDLELAGKKIALRPGDIDKSLPLGLAAYSTRAAWRDIRLRRLDAKPPAR